MYHFRKKHLDYLQKNANTTSCPFCDPKNLEKVVHENAHALVVPNLTFYDVWETHDVVDHLLIIPKRHVIGLNELTKAERAAVMDLMAEYDGQGYNVYARAPGNKRKSVEHQHTHLIKISGERARVYLATQKPYFVVKF